jgi:hypothetical protein
VGVQHRPDTLGGNRDRGSTETVNNPGQDRGVGAGPDRGALHPDPAHVGGDEDLGVAQLGLHGRVPLGILDDLVGGDLVESGGVIAWCRHQPVLGKQGAVLRGRQPRWRVGVDGLERGGRDLREGLAQDGDRLLSFCPPLLPCDQLILEQMPKEICSN